MGDSVHERGFESAPYYGENDIRKLIDETLTEAYQAGRWEEQSSPSARKMAPFKAKAASSCQIIVISRGD